MSVDDTVAFLRLFAGRHSLSGIHPETRAIESRLFASADDPALREWIEARAGKVNLYFTVNEPSGDAPRDRKVAKKDICRVRALHVDLDPRTDLPVDEARREIEATLARSAGIQKHGLVVDTGGGFAGFLLLGPGCDIEPAAAERLNRKLAAHFGGDSAHNIDRLMRLPGTVNLPGAKKRAAGRAPRLARLVHAAAQPLTPEALEAVEALPAPPEHAAGDSEAQRQAITEALEDIRRAPWEDPPQDVRQRLDAALDASPALLAIHEGKHQHQDQSTSGYRMALAGHAKAAGLSAGDYACLAELGAKTAQRGHEDDREFTRQLARAFGRAEGPHQPAPADPAAFFAPQAELPATVWDAVPAEKRPPLQPIFPGRFPNDLVPPETPWLLKNLVPMREVTSFYAPGGTGKTQFLIQLGVCIATGMKCLGMDVPPGKVLLVLCEDSDDDIQRRLLQVLKHYGLSFSDLGDRFAYLARRGEDNLLCTFNRDGRIQLTEFHGDLMALATELQPVFIGVDTATDTFGGQEIERTHVNAYIKIALGRLALATGAAVIVTAHPSRAGQQSGDYLSGSTHWENAVRSRIAFFKPKGVKNRNVRRLENKKLNAGPDGTVLQVEWHNGAYRLLGATDAPEPAQAAPALSLRDLVLAAVQGHAGPLTLSRNSPHYAPPLLALVLRNYQEIEVLDALREAVADGSLVVQPMHASGQQRPIQALRVSVFN